MSPNLLPGSRAESLEGHEERKGPETGCSKSGTHTEAPLWICAEASSEQGQMPHCVPPCPYTTSRGPAQRGDGCWDVAVRVPGCGEKFLVVTFLPSLSRREGEDGAVEELSLLCQPGTLNAQHVPREPTESQTCWFLENTPSEKPPRLARSNWTPRELPP